MVTKDRIREVICKNNDFFYKNIENNNEYVHFVFNDLQIKVLTDSLYELLNKEE